MRSKKLSPRKATTEKKTKGVCNYCGLPLEKHIFPGANCYSLSDQPDGGFPGDVLPQQIFIDGDFNDSYESRVKRAKGKRKNNSEGAKH